MSGIVETAAMFGSAVKAGGAMATLAKVGLGVTAAGSVLGGLSAWQDGQDQSKYYEANADYAMGDARNRAAATREQYRRLAGSQRAAFGASGVDVNEGSALDVLAGTDAEAELSAMQILYGGQMEAANWKAKSAMAKSAGKQQLFGGLLKGIGSAALLGSQMGLFGSPGGEGLGHVFDGNRTGGVGGGWTTTPLGSR
ncbi:MAG TPA: hypothetical protein VE028_01645 [Nitratidesulfovibrio sp.]|nr:hypothetical protein [Nitratidesulfovibrio sp.]